MSLRIGIVGLPNVGKSTLFRALTKKQVDIANYPFVTIEPNIGIVEVPDNRVDRLAELNHSAKKIYATVEFVDIAGLVKGAAEGEGLGNKFLTHIREVDAIAEVVRVFEEGEIIHIAGVSDPLSDIEVLEYELILKDLETVNKRLESLQKEVRSGKKGAPEELAELQKVSGELKTGRFQHSNILHLPAGQAGNVGMLEGLQLLTAKPFVYVFNASEKQIQEKWEPDHKLKNKIGSAQYAIISAKIEAELAELPDKEKEEYLKSLGVETDGLDLLIRVGYQTLNLITFLTTGEDETRAWTIRAGSTAPEAGRAIHSDFEEKFIRAEVISYEKLIEAGSLAKARELGWIRTEGKNYAVQDGDVTEFKI